MRIKPREFNLASVVARGSMETWAKQEITNTQILKNMFQKENIQC